MAIVSPRLICLISPGHLDVVSLFEFQTGSSLVSSAAHSKLKISLTNQFNSGRTSFAHRRQNKGVSCSSSLVHEAGMWTSTLQRQLNSPCSRCLLVTPSILALMFAVRAESAPSVATRSVLSNVVGLLFLRSPQWRGAQRFIIQLSFVLILANALRSDIVAPDPNDTFENVPQDISGGEPRKRIQRPKFPKAERCTQKCLGTCIRGGEGPFNIRKPLVVFKEGFRTRNYCLIECSDICNLIADGDDGP